MNKTLFAFVSHPCNKIFDEGIISYIFLVLVVLLLLPVVKLSRTELNLFFSVLSWLSLLLAYTHTVLARYTRGKGEGKENKFYLVFSEKIYFLIFADAIIFFNWNHFEKFLYVEGLMKLQRRFLRYVYYMDVYIPEQWRN